MIAGLALGILSVLAVLADPVRAEPVPVPVAGWVAPLPAPLTVTRSFDPPETRYGAGHRGVDLAAPPGSTIAAAGPGTVVFAGPLAGRGVVSIEHAGGLRTTYEPVSPLVAAGQTVSGGQPIGELTAGHPGCPATACLHWGLRRGEIYLDPLALLDLGPVRLFPRYGGGTAFRPAIPGLGTDPGSGLPGSGLAALSAPLPVLATLVGLVGVAGTRWRRRRSLPVGAPGTRVPANLADGDEEPAAAPESATMFESTTPSGPIASSGSARFRGRAAPGTAAPGRAQAEVWRKAEIGVRSVVSCFRRAVPGRRRPARSGVTPADEPADRPP